MSIFSRLFSRGPDRKDAMVPLYNSVITLGRQPHWYLDGGVADDVEGRFNLLVTLLSLVLLRLEDAPDKAEAGVALTELFVDDMDGQLRQEGVGDVVVGKRVGKMMSILGGRLGGLREAFALEDHDARRAALEDVLRRNVYQTEVSEEALGYACDGMIAVHAGLVGRGIDTVLAGEIL
ncbi:ubiquinol-cytochrome C chaperone family protein [Alterisphingorhabdus coralli]|uniref:Ubiquinol-cytochrome C chaperone family protein n=1 Tax=Alterisphingorhabdus coralli TaxID=3071408 RepID=A0AA97F6P9_9SPHN|nr:ubiquinol-cytochrome C chaperone family protein [Parasphingorhabdus sp. SCSIO 66989]WOE75206.1 ubiquinol-cytochrome C chaperone family protein [Parasphingorhabdus sp. SCSIO 66989]